MNKSILNKGTKLLALAAGVVLFSTASYAQDLYNGATGKINNEGTIRVNDDNAIISNEQTNTALIQNTGEIHIFGTDVDFVGAQALTSTSTLRIPGFVSYRAGAGTQNIHEGYYDDLDVQDASAKAFTAATPSYFIGGDYTTAGGNRDYTGSTVTYDGGSGTTGATGQAIAAENTGNGTGYNNLAFGEDALKTLSSGLAYVGNTTDVLASTAGGGVSIDGATSALQAVGTFTQATGAGDYSLNNGGTTDLEGDNNTIDAVLAVNDGTLTIGDGSNAYSTTINTAGSLNLANAATAVLNVDASATMNVNGGFTNLNPARTNQTFAGTSTVDYQTGASSIVTTASANPYGNFIISKNDVDISPTANGGTENDVNVATSFAINSGFDLDMAGSTGGIVNFTNATPGNVTYLGQGEVIGGFRRTHAFADASTYTFGNAGTQVAMTAAPGAGNFFEIYMDKDGQNNNYDNTRDVKRQVEIDYDLATWEATIQVGYTGTDVDEDGNWNTGYAESQIRYLEGETAAASTERVATGQPYDRTGAAGAGPQGFSTIALPGMTQGPAIDGTADAGFFAANELILRAGPGIVASINPGRWSNPATWDSGAEPLPFDSVVVRHNVWAGFVRPNNDNYTVDEATPGQMAAAIQVIEPNATYQYPTLMIGHSDITAPFATNLDVPNGIEGRLTTGALNATYPEALPATLLNELPTTDASTSYRGGLIIFADGTAGQGGDMTISGEMVNNGCINVGGVLSLGQ